MKSTWVWRGVLSVHDGEGMAAGVGGCLFTVGKLGNGGDQEQGCPETLRLVLSDPQFLQLGSGAPQPPKPAEDRVFRNHKPVWATPHAIIVSTPLCF